MCGIVGFSIRSQSACRPFVNGLRRLEYRGYDSAGVAFEAPDGLRVFKRTGKVAELDSFLAGELPENERGKYTFGIVHTRWATRRRRGTATTCSSCRARAWRARRSSRPSRCSFSRIMWRGCEIDQPRNLAKSVTVE